MDKNKLYRISKALARLKSLSEVSNLHGFRFAHFVDSSPQKLECRYAKATLDLFIAEKESEKIKDQLRAMKREIDVLLGELNET